ncbi:hypothetical protein TNCV_2314551 [Trichonephila clavipes]|nr:hypothetical protein TNCV_2314551 [Trichonephila clavipes]
MGTTIHHRAWDRRSRLVGENHNRAVVRVMRNTGVVIVVGNMRNRLKKTIEELKIEVLIGCSWTPVASAANLTARFIVASADIARTPDLFQGAEQFFVREYRLCYDLRGRNFNNSSDNHLSLHF